MIKTQRGRSRKSQRGQTVLNPIEVENFSEQGNRSPWLPKYTEQGKVLLGVFQENSQPGGRKALTKDFPASKATNRPDRQDTHGQVFHVFSCEIQTVSRCIVSLFNYTAPLLQTYVLQ